MKTNCFFTIAAALGLSLSMQAQQPGPDPIRPKDSPPPVSRPDARPDMQRHDSDRWPNHGPGPQAKPDVQRPHPHGGHAASGQDRDGHIREALRHLREAGLGDMAERIEHAMGHRREGQERRHHRHSRWMEHGKRDAGSAFAAPQRIPNPRPDSARGPEPKREQNPGMEELRSQVQRLTREVEALKNAMKQRTPEPAREQIRRPDEPRREDRRDGPPREERRED
jgi:hypothetical protein